MPIYEYRCQDCGRLSSVFVRTVSSTVDPSCEHCGSKAMNRALSKFAYHKSEQTILEEFGEPGLDAGPYDYKDPRQIGRWAERRFEEFGIEMPDEARDMIDAARQGELPEGLGDL